MANTPTAPATNIVTYQTLTSDINGDPYATNFTGNPGPMVDEAWTGLMRGEHDHKDSEWLQYLYSVKPST